LLLLLMENSIIFLLNILLRYILDLMNSLKKKLTYFSD
jgi:hypothetical protein